MTKAYCGSNPTPPPNTHLGTETECIKAKQVRRYGVKQVDTTLLAQSKINVEKERKKLFRIKGKLDKLEREIELNKIQIKRDKVTDSEKDKYKDANKIFKKEMKELKLKESEIINLIKDIPEETKKDSEDKMADRKVMMVRYKTRVERINKDLEQVPDDKKLLKEKEEAIKKYNFYKNKKA
jgi:hypothetical protein